MKNLESSDIALLQGWFDQSLSDEDRKLVEERLQNDPNFKKGAEELRQLLNGLHTLRRAEWRNQLQNATLDGLEDVKIESRGKWKWWVAIGAILLAIISYLFYQHNYSRSKMSPIALESTNLVNKDWPAPMGNISSEDLFKQAKRAYENQQYPRASRKLSKYLEQKPRDWKAELMLIVAYLKNGRGDLAWPHIQRMESKGESYELTIWYKAVALVQQNKLAEASPLLKELAGGKIFQREAQTLLNSIKL